MIKPNQEIVAKINDYVYRFGNQYFYGESVGVYLMNLEDRILLFDIPEYSKEIEEFVLSFDKPIECILSHGSCGIKAGDKWRDKINLKIYLHKNDKDHSWLRIKPDLLFSDQKELNFPSNIEVIHTPGHSAGSICLLEKNTNTLFTGDTIGGEGGKIRDFFRFESDDVIGRFQSCQVLLDYSFDHILPFHYEMILEVGYEVLQDYVESFRQ